MHHEQSHETARALVAPFYDVLTRPSQKNVAAIVSEIAIPEWPFLIWYGMLRKSSSAVIASSSAARRAALRRVTSSVSRTVGAASRS